MRFTFDEKGHKYELDGKPMMGVTSVLQIIGKPALIGWAAKQTSTWIRLNRIIEGTAGLEDAVYRVSEADLKIAEGAHTKKKESAGVSGKDTHALIEDFVKESIRKNDGHPLDLAVHWEHKPGVARGVFTGKVTLPPLELIQFRKWAVDNGVKFLASEERMYSKDWWVAGTADLILEMGGKKYIGDVKTQAKLWDNTPHVQCAAYAKMYKEMGKGDIDGTIIIVIPRETSKVETHLRYNLESDIKAFEAALLLYKTIPIQ